MTKRKEIEVKIKDQEVFIFPDSKRDKFLSELEKVREYCFKKTKHLEKILDNKIKVDIFLNLNQKEK